MDPLLQSRYDAFLRALKTIEATEQPRLQKAKQSAGLSVVAMRAVRTFIAGQPLKTPTEEIEFYKNTEPLFRAQLIYWLHVLEYEVRKLTINSVTRKRYITIELRELCRFFEHQIELYRYWRCGETRFDTLYFISQEQEPGEHVDDLQISYSHKIARFIAYERFSAFLDDELKNNFELNTADKPPASTELKWTAPQTHLVELLYAFSSSGIFNNGNATLAQLAAFFENHFGVRLGNYYRTFQEIRIRKKGRTVFIDTLREKLIQRMDDADENPKQF